MEEFYFDLSCILAHKLYTFKNYANIAGGIEISSDSIFTIINQDLEVASKAINDGDFHFVTIIGNRIMTNLYALNKNELMILGWILRDIGGDLLNISTRNKNVKEKIISNAKKLAIDYLISLQSDITQNSLNSKNIYDKYEETQSEMRKFILSKRERLTYDEESEFSKQFALKIIEVFYTYKDKAFSKNSNLIPIIANELARNYNEHGGREALASYFVFRTFAEFYKYASFEKFENSTGLWDLNSKLSEYLELIDKFRRYLIKDDDRAMFETLNEIVVGFGSDFRLYYLYYGELITQGRTREEKVELSPESRQKIGEIIAKSLQKEFESGE